MGSVSGALGRGVAEWNGAAHGETVSAGPAVPIEAQKTPDSAWVRPTCREGRECVERGVWWRWAVGSNHTG